MAGRGPPYRDREEHHRYKTQAPEGYGFAWLGRHQPDRDRKQDCDADKRDLEPAPRACDSVRGAAALGTKPLLPETEGQNGYPPHVAHVEAADLHRELLRVASHTEIVAERDALRPDSIYTGFNMHVRYRIPRV